MVFVINRIISYNFYHYINPLVVYINIHYLITSFLENPCLDRNWIFEVK